MNFSAVILAGGDSSRMGRDKAFLDCRGGSLLARQIRMVSLLRPREILISGRPGTDYRAYGCRVLHDEIPGCGPLAGIARGLAAVESPLALVLAVDMPAMRSGLLRWLESRCSESVGAVPQPGARLEPLAAFYPRSAGRLALELLTERALAVAHFAALCSEARLVGLYAPPPRYRGCFANWNRPGDVAASLMPSARQKA